jgi:iron(III) transport system permease protein
MDGFSLSKMLVLLLAIVVLMPVAGLTWNAFQSQAGSTDAFAWGVLAEFFTGSLLLSAAVAVGVTLVGALPAWLVAQFEFPGRRWLEWLLVLPLAMPAYIMAYGYADFLQYAGPLQSALRETFDWQARSDYWFPDIRSLPGAMLILTLALYPYVYVLARVAFLEMPPALLEAARIGGHGRLAVLWRVALPVARPALVAGAALAAMEALADFGTVSYFGVPTLTTGIFKAWFGQGNLPLASQLGLVLLIFAVAAMLLERASRSRAKYHHNTVRAQPRFRIHSRKRWLASLICLLPCMAGFVLPVALLIRLAMKSNAGIDAGFSTLALNSILLASAAALLTVVCATALAYAARKQDPLMSALNRAAGTGYAVPGLVLAVGIAVPAIALDKALVSILQNFTAQPLPLLISGGVGLLLYAYLARFLGIGLHAVESGLAKITSSIEDAARSMGASANETLRRVHLPMMRGSVAMAALLVLVDVLKELPATFVLRPFNFDTLAVRVYALAMDERLGEAAAPALLIVAIATVPVVLTTRAFAGRSNS